MNFRISLILFLLSCILPVAAQKPEPVKIGLLIQDQASLAARQGAELAVRKANVRGGVNGRPIQLVVRSMEGPWGMGSKQAVNLIFEENVWALLGSHEGRNAHLVEQAATKSTVVFISAWSSDPTLSQAFVPWFFTCVPNDRQQADVMIEEIYNKRKIIRVAVISDQNYDSGQALKSFLKQANLAGKKEPVQFLYENYLGRLDELADQIIKAKISCIIIFCQPSASLKIIRLIRQKEMNLPVFGSLSILNENKLTGQELLEFENIMLFPSGTWSGSKSTVFRQEYEKAFGKTPGMVAAYAFDGINLLIEAIRNSGGPEREKIQQALSNIHYEGVTGQIQFDDKGNRKGTYRLMNIKSMIPIEAKQ